ncbi:MAG: MFS transporter [Actinobacteria bacterium]|nr:MFS transporter [Actinomycetota bacterium]
MSCSPGVDGPDRAGRPEPSGEAGRPESIGESGRGLFGLRRNVFVAGVVSFFMDMSSEMVYPLVPLFLSSVLGINKSLIGLIEGIAETTASLLKVASGWYSDRIGRRKALMGAGYGISAVSRIGLALAGSWGHVLGARFVDRVGKGVRTAPRDAIIADSSISKDLGRSFGFHRAMDQFGAVLGPAVAFLVLTAQPGGYRTVFWLSLIPGLLAVGVVVFFIEERRVPGRRRVQGSPADGSVDRSAGRPGDACAHGAANSDSGLGMRGRVARLRGPLLGYLTVTGLFSLGNFSDAFLILRAEDLGLTAALIPLAYLLFNLVYSALSVPAGLLADRYGRRSVLAFGYLLFAATQAGLGAADSPVHVWVLFALYGAYMGFADGTGRALLAELAPAERRATAFGAYHAVAGVTALPASVFAGVLWDRVSPAAPFWVGAGTALAAAALLLLVVPAQTRTPAAG